MTPSATGETPEPTPPTDLDALEQIARAASPGLWEYTWTDEAVELNKGTALSTDLGKGFRRPASSWNTADRLMDFDVEDFDEEEARQVACDAEHIAAARPEVMLALIARLRTAEARTRPAPLQRGLYRNHHGVELRVIDPTPAGYVGVGSLGGIWYAEGSSPTFGPEGYLVTAEAMHDAGYVRIEDQEGPDER